MLTFYSLLFFLFSPLILAGFVWRYGLRRTLRGFPERFVWGGPRPTVRRVLWIHAASVGEVRAVEGFLRALPGRFPGLPRLLTTTTVNAKELAERLSLAEEVRLAPLDRPWAMHRVIDRYAPRAVLLVETELWPHWLNTLAARHVPVGVINGRISDGAFPVYYRLRGFWAPLLGRLARVGVQSPANASRFLQLGAHPEAVAITGNLKFDVPLPDPARRFDLRRVYRVEGPVWVAGSTHRGEEEAVLKAFLDVRGDRSGLALVIAPRHVERAAEVRRLAEAAGLRAELRSRLSAGASSWEVLVLDTVGELPEVYGLAALAYVGGSLVPRGGQNPLEPARWGVPVVVGPHMENFREMAQVFREGDALVEVSDAPSLTRAVRGLLADPARAEALGARARARADAQRGALAANLDLTDETLRSLPRPPGGDCGVC